jgi:hypothetical protein
VVEVFEQPKAIDLCQVGVRFRECQRSGHLDRDLFVADGGLQRGLIGRVEPVDQRHLMLLRTAQASQVVLEVPIHARAHMAEAQLIGLDAVHEDHAYARKGIVVELAVRGLNQLLPRESLLFEWRPVIFQ